MEITIEEYIRQSRIEKYLPKDYSEKVSRYIDIFRTISDIEQINFKYPNLYCCYTLVKSCEMVVLNGESYLIYDMALGQYMSFLNTFINCKDDMQDVLEWFYSRCEAEIFCANSEFEAAILSKIKVDCIQESHSDVFSKYNAHLPISEAMTYIQECFVMLHEVSHFRLNSISREEYNQQILSMREWVFDVDLNKLDDRDSNKMREFLESDEFSGSIQLTSEAFDTIYNSHIKFEQEYYSKDSNIEEIICDDYSLSLLLNNRKCFLPILTDIYGFELDERSYYYLVCYSCQVALESLAILEILENRCTSIKSQLNDVEMSKTNKLEDPFSSSLARKRSLIHSMIRILVSKDPVFSEGLPMLTLTFDNSCLFLWEALIHRKMSKEAQEKYDFKVNNMQDFYDNETLLVLKEVCLARVRQW